MPKERRKKSISHDPSVKLAKRHFAAQEAAVEKVEIGSLEDVPGIDILQSMEHPDEHRITLKKKEKQHIKREAFIEKLHSTRSPYSKTQKRRFKRKQDEQVGGGLDAIQAAISALDNNDQSDSKEEQVDSAVSDSMQTKMQPKLGQIGEGKGVPLKRNQRKRALEMEKLRAPMILANPDYALNPFQTLRTHAQNTLLKREHLSS